MVYIDWWHIAMRRTVCERLASRHVVRHMPSLILQSKITDFSKLQIQTVLPRELHEWSQAV